MEATPPHYYQAQTITDPAQIAHYKQIVQNFAPYEAFLKILDQAPDCIEFLSLETNYIIFKENSLHDDLYFLVEGEVTNYKKNLNNENVEINRYKPGALLGRSDFIDEIPRIASSIATTPTIVIKLHSNIKSKHPLLSNALIKELMPLYGVDMRKTYKRYVQEMQEKLAAQKLQVTMGKVLICMVLVLSFFSLFNVMAAKQLTKTTDTGIFGVIVLSILMFFLIVIYKITNLPLFAYGITWRNGKAAFLGSILYTLPFCVLILGIKYLLIQYYPPFQNEPLFQPYAGINVNLVPRPLQLQSWLGSIALYGFFSAPIQELIARGFTQQPLAILLGGRHHAITSNIVANIMFMTPHFFLSPLLAFLIFIPGLFFGWLMYKYQTLIAPIVAHAMIGIWSLCIVGFIQY